MPINGRSVQTQTENMGNDGTTAFSRSLCSINSTCQSLLNVRTHCHTPLSESAKIKSRLRLRILSVLCLLLMLCTCAAGIWANSLCVILNAVGLGVNFASIMIALFRIWLATRSSTQRYNFGWYRAEVIATLFSLLLIWFLIGGLCYMAMKRLLYGNFDVKAEVMMVTSAVAAIVNVVLGIQLHLAHSENCFFGCNQIIKQPYRPKIVVLDNVPHLICLSNERFLSPFRNQGCQTDFLWNGRDAGLLKNYGKNSSTLCLHAIRDTLQSLAAFITALVIYFQPYLIVLDPVLCLICAFAVLSGTLFIMRDTLLVLMESTPDYLDYNEILQILLAIPGVKNVHGLRIWAINLNHTACLAHLEIDENCDPLKVLHIARETIHKHFNFYETTLQIE